MFKRYLNFFFTGLSTLLPLSITVFILYKSFRFIDGIFGWMITRFVGYPIIGLGFALTMITITLFGMVARNYLAQKLIGGIEHITLKIPIVQVIYSGLKELSHLFTKKGVKNFTDVVTVKFPNDDTLSIGFVTKESVLIGSDNKLSVFIPTTPNPGNGFLIFVDKDKVTYLDISIEDAIKSIVSMGTITPESISHL